MSDFDKISDGMVANATAKWGMGGGTVTSVFGAVSSNELLVIVGVVTTVAGFLINLYFQMKRDKRAETEFLLREQLLKKQIENADGH